MAYSAITWNGNDLVAVKDIAALGFKGIQLRANTFPVFREKPEDRKLTLDSARLELAMFSSGNVGISSENKKKKTIVEVKKGFDQKNYIALYRVPEKYNKKIIEPVSSIDLATESVVDWLERHPKG